MKAIIGRKAVKEWAGLTMTQAMVVGIAKEHEALGTVHKCGAEFEGHKCARPAGHEGFHFSTVLLLTLPAKTEISAAWEKENEK